MFSSAMRASISIEMYALLPKRKIVHAPREATAAAAATAKRVEEVPA